MSSTIILLSLTAFLGVADPVHHEEFLGNLFRRANREGREGRICLGYGSGNKPRRIKRSHSCFESYGGKISRMVVEIT